MFVTDDDVKAGITLASATDAPCLTLPTNVAGGWIKSENWWTRSVLAST